MNRNGDDRGRGAARPRDIPKRGWKDVLVRVKNEASEDNLSIVGAGVAFYLLLAIFPAIAAAVSLWGVFASPAMLQQQLSTLGQVLPQQAYQIIEQQLRQVAGSGGSVLSFAAAGSLLLTLWSAGKGVKALITGLNIAYDEEDQRGFFKLTGLVLLLTLGAIVFGLIVLALIAFIPALAGSLGLPSWLQGLALIARWPVLVVLLMVALSVLYWVGPHRDRPLFRWVSWGAAIATVLWLIASIGFSIFVSRFGSYNETYGSLGAVVVLLMWLFITAFVILLGAELNAELEHQTARDTTARPRKPMGERGAHVADTLGEPASGPPPPRREDRGEARW